MRSSDDEGQCANRDAQQGHEPESEKPVKPKHFRPCDFRVAADLSHCICPAGKRLYRNGTNCNIGGHRAIKFTGTQRDCEKCPLRAQCLRRPQRTSVRQVAIFVGKHANAQETASERMKRKIDTEHGREMIGRRFATVEMVHNIEKLAHHGYAR